VRIKIYTAFAVIILLAMCIGCGSTAPTEPENDETAVDRVLRMVGPFDINDIDSYPEIEAVVMAIQMELDVGPFRFAMVNDPNCNLPELKPFPVFLRGTFMTLDEQNMYFSGHIVLATFGTFDPFWPGGPSGCDIYWLLYDILAAMDQGTGYFFQYMVDVQETNRFGMFCTHTPNCLGQCGYDVPVVWDADPCPLDIPCTR